MTTQEINKTIEEYEYYKSITIGKRQVQYFDEVIEMYGDALRIINIGKDSLKQLSKDLKGHIDIINSVKSIAG